jgi:hypothetical protein
MILLTKHKCRQAFRAWANSSLRPIIQGVFLALILAIGVQFAAFVWQLEYGIEFTMSRPPAVEDFLPRSIFSEHSRGEVPAYDLLALGIDKRNRWCRHRRPVPAS